MTWHAADTPLPAGAVQTFSTPEAEPACVRPHSPRPGARHWFPCYCSPLAPESTFSTLPSQIQPSFSAALLHSPVSGTDNSALQTFHCIITQTGRAGSTGSCSSKQGVSFDSPPHSLVSLASPSPSQGSPSPLNTQHETVPGRQYLVRTQALPSRPTAQCSRDAEM